MARLTSKEVSHDKKETTDIHEPDEVTDIHADGVVSRNELLLKSAVKTAFRSAIAIFIIAGVYDFLFSAIWLHGYVWTLNQKYTRGDHAENTAGDLVTFHSKLYPDSHRVVGFIAALLGVIVWLWSIGCTNCVGNVWKLWRAAGMLATLLCLLRCFQQKHRIFPAIHEGFYVYVTLFSVSLVMLVRKNTATGAKKLS